MLTLDVDKVCPVVTIERENILDAVRSHLREKEAERLGLPYIGGATAAAWAFYNDFHLRIADGTWDLDSPPTMKMALLLSTSNFATVTNNVYADLTNEVAAVNGYATGGVAMSGETWTRSAGTATFTAGNTTFTASGGNIVFRAMVCYQNATVNTIIKALMCYSIGDSTPADTTITNGTSLAIAMNASGTFTLTG